MKLSFRCPVRLVDMPAVEGGRHCGSCNKHVRNLTDATLEEIAAHRAADGCGSYRTTANGHIVTRSMVTTALLVALAACEEGDAFRGQHSADTAIDTAPDTAPPTTSPSVVVLPPPPVAEVVTALRPAVEELLSKPAEQQFTWSEQRADLMRRVRTSALVASFQGRSQALGEWLAEVGDGLWSDHDDYNEISSRMWTGL